MNPSNSSSFYRSLIKAPITLSTRNELGNWMASVKAKADPRRWNEIQSSSSKFQDSLAFLRKNGFLHLTLPYASELADSLQALPNTGKGVLAAGGRTETEALSGVEALPLMQKLMTDQSLYSLVSLYLGAPAHLHTFQAWWQYPMGDSHKPSNAQQWHRDRDDFSELKLFFYGSDVDDTAGPHAFIPKSHNPESLSDIFSQKALSNSVINGTTNEFFGDAFLKSVGFSGSIKTWLGNKGTCFLEDTRGFHRAYLPESKSRLIMSLVWTIGPGFAN